MIKKDFHSKLFKRTIKKDEKDFASIVKSELLFRINDLKIKNCSCFQCQLDLEKYEKYYKKLNESNEKFQPE